MLVSSDSGRTWTEHRVSAGIIGVAATSGHLWLYGPPGALWSSTDAGARWRPITPAFPLAGRP